MTDPRGEGVATEERGSEGIELDLGRCDKAGTSALEAPSSIPLN